MLFGHHEYGVSEKAHLLWISYNSCARITLLDLPNFQKLTRISIRSNFDMFTCIVIVDTMDDLPRESLTHLFGTNHQPVG